MQDVNIAVDAMGGDHGPEVLIPGLALAQRAQRKEGKDAHYIIFGDEKRILPLLNAEPNLKKVSTLVHKPLVIEMDEKPGQALRRGRGESSMWGAVSAVKDKNADVCISCGNTGALMAISKVTLRTLPGILRPAIAGVWPTLSGYCIVLDLGATISDDAMHLVQFAVMGQAFSRVCLDVAKPKVALLNIGKEEIKGTQPRRDAAALLEKMNLPMDFTGFIEGDDIGMGIADVVVTDGFSGNIALKVGEGTVRQILEVLKSEIKSSFWGKLGYCLLRPTLAACKKRFSPKFFNGGIFLGLNGLVVKSHGRSDATDFSMGVQAAGALVERNLQEKIVTNMSVIEEVIGFEDI